MTNWTGRLDFVQEWKDAEEGKVTPAEHCQKIAERLGASRYARGRVVVEAIARLEDLAKDHATTLDDFDGVLESLYDWADERRVWIATS